jgi:hypothetical protein
MRSASYTRDRLMALSAREVVHHLGTRMTLVYIYSFVDDPVPNGGSQVCLSDPTNKCVCTVPNAVLLKSCYECLYSLTPTQDVYNSAVSDFGSESSFFPSSITIHTESR